MDLLQVPVRTVLRLRVWAGGVRDHRSVILLYRGGCTEEDGVCGPVWDMAFENEAKIISSFE